jgi:hypothetical protein
VNKWLPESPNDHQQMQVYCSKIGRRSCESPQVKSVGISWLVIGDKSFEVAGKVGSKMFILHGLVVGCFKYIHKS